MQTGCIIEAGTLLLVNVEFIYLLQGAVLEGKNIGLLILIYSHGTYDCGDSLKHHRVACY